MHDERYRRRWREPGRDCGGRGRGVCGLGSAAVAVLVAPSRLVVVALLVVLAVPACWGSVPTRVALTVAGILFSALGWPPFAGAMAE